MSYQVDIWPPSNKGFSPNSSLVLKELEKKVNDSAKMMSYGTEAAVPRQAQIQGEALQLAENCEVLAKMIDDLSIRINPILRAEDDPITHQRVQSENPVERYAPHADFLRSRNMMLKQAMSQLESVLRRIEL